MCFIGSNLSDLPNFLDRHGQANTGSFVPNVVTNIILPSHIIYHTVNIPVMVCFGQLDINLNMYEKRKI